MTGLLSSLPILLLVAAIATGLAVLVHNRPKFGVALWLATVGFVPIWYGLTFSFYFFPATLVGVFVLLVTLPGMPRRYGLADFFIAFLFVTCLVPIVTGGGTIGTVFVVLSQWLLGFLLGRLLPLAVDVTWIYGCVAVVFTAVSLGGIGEFAAKSNPYVNGGPSNPLFARWGVLQERSDLLRAEWAFGHSIALGCSIALAIPLVFASGFRLTVRLGMVAVMLVCVTLTFSRVAMISATLAVLISVIFQQIRIPSHVRYLTIGLFSVVTVALAPFVLGVFGTAGDEATVSANYRENLTELVPDLSVIGLSPAAYRSPSGDLYFGRFQSIDSQVLLTGLTYGWFTMALGILMLLGAFFLVLRRRASPATIAIVCQVPALATVALITQYSIFFWFACGLAVFGQVGPTTLVVADTAFDHDGHAKDPGSPAFSRPPGVLASELGSDTS